MESGQMTYEWKQAGLKPWTTGHKNGGYTPGEAAFSLAIAYVWLSESSIGKTRSGGDTAAFARFQEYVFGCEDGVPKTPQWAARFCGVPSYTIKALARRWSPEEALARGIEADMAELISTAELLPAEPTAGPVPRCTDEPGSLVGGTVYDYETDEVIEGARVSVKPAAHHGASGTEAAGQASRCVTTDYLGNFLVDMPAGDACLISIEKEGYEPKRWGPVAVGDGAGLRDFAMFVNSKGIIQ